MTNKKQRQMILDYLVNKLEQAGNIIQPKSRELYGIKTNGIWVNGEEQPEKSLIFLVDQIFGRDNFEEIVKRFNPECFIFYKDGETFFRNAAEKVHGFRKDIKSLKYYTNEQIHRMIALRPEEIFIIRRRDILQYYQPESERLEEAIVNFPFRPVRFNYDHINRSEKFKPADTDSKRIFLWDRETKMTNPIKLGNFNNLFANYYLIES